METFYITRDHFWEWFNRADNGRDAPETTGQHFRHKTSAQLPASHWSDSWSGNSNKRLKTEGKPRSTYELETATRSSERYDILYGPHKPSKKTKVWEGDGYLTLIGRMAHLSDLRGRLLEEPTILDDMDRGIVKDLGELVIGNTEVQVIELNQPR